MFGYSFGFMTVLSLYSIMQIVSLLPISINGIGVNEALIVFLFGTLGVPAEISLGIAILSRLVMFGQTSIGGLIYGFSKI
jgi:glycosyltransferase 2 family protein